METGKWIRNSHFDNLWPDNPLSFWNISEKGIPVSITWSKCYFEDYLKLSDEYYYAGIKIVNEVIHAGHDNLKDDSWFLAGIFMFRQAIELVIKARIYSLIHNKREIQSILIEDKHDLSSLFLRIKKLNGISNMSYINLNWLDTYLKDLNELDSNSTVFRYPLDVKFLSKNPPKFVDVYRTSVKMDLAYSLLRSIFNDGKSFSDNLPTVLPKPKFFSIAKNGIENCYLVHPNSFSRYYLMINGYLSVSEFLLSNHIGCESKRLYFPEMFSIRQLLELELKQLVSSEYSEIANLKIRHQSHKIYTDFWTKLNPVINNYGDSSNILNNISGFIELFQKIDNSGDFFRYPSSYSHEYHTLIRPIDPINILSCVRSITNLFEGCDAMFYDYAELEQNML